MNRPRLAAVALTATIALVAGTGIGTGAALADDPSSPSPTPSAQPGADSPSADPSASASPSPSPLPEGAGNQAPLAADDRATVNAGGSVTVQVLANDSDPDGGPSALRVTGTDDPRATHTDTIVTFRAARTDSGTVPVHYTVTDGQSDATGTLHVTIKPAARTVGITVPKPIVALRSYRITGRIAPTYLGRPSVQLQRKKGDSWVGVKTVDAGADGKYAVPFRTNRPITYVFRAKAVWRDGKIRYSDTRKRVVQVLADAKVSGPLNRSQVPYSYRSGCPVAPSGLRKITINRINYDHNVARGTLVVRASAVSDMVSVFKAAIHDGFPVKSMNPTDVYYAGGSRTPTQSDEAAMRAGNTAAFNCRPVTGNPYRVSQHSYGNAIDINTIQNPYVTGSRVYPESGREYLDRSPYRKGMILRGGVIASKMANLGWPWGARWSHPDYQHFSSNGG